MSQSLSVSTASIKQVKLHLQKRKQRKGLSIPEIVVIAALLTLIAIFSVPAINNLVMEYRAPKVAEEMQRFVARMKAVANTPNGSPYTNVDNGHMARALDGSSVVAIAGTGSTAVISHRLGDGEISVASADSGNKFAITFDEIVPAACTSIVTILSAISDEVTVGSTVLKSATVDFNPMTADTQCFDLPDTGEVEFVIS